MRYRQIKSEQGDTIVEVLICIAILGFVLAAAYTLTTRNATTAQKSQERARAVGVAETQIERLRSYFDNNPKATLDVLPSHFCLVKDVNNPPLYTTANPSGAKPVPLIALPSPNTTPQAAVAADASTVYPTECRDGVDNLFDIAIWKAGAPAESISASAVVAPSVNGLLDAKNVYAVTVRWDAAGGGGQEEVKMFYSIFTRPTP